MEAMEFDMAALAKEVFAELQAGCAGRDIRFEAEALPPAQGDRVLLRQVLMTESAQDGIVIIDDAGLITDWNSAAERMFGYRRQEVLGENLHRLLAPTRYLDAYEQSWPNFRETGRGAVVGRTTEAAGLRRDRSEFPVEVGEFSLAWVGYADPG